MAVFEMAGHLIRRLHQQSVQIFAQRTQEAGFDVTAVQYAALEAIHENPAMDQAFIAELIGYDRATIGGVIERLEKKLWVRRIVSPRDRRARELFLTPEGNRARLALQPIVQALQNDILQPLTRAEQAQFMALARAVVLPSSASE
jgi:DNA-binding MarR family transcriptional regulator